jgi:hypothetical protein
MDQKMIIYISSSCTLESKIAIENSDIGLSRRDKNGIINKHLNKILSHLLYCHKNSTFDLFLSECTKYCVNI